jgi:hypothetical protein
VLVPAIEEVHDHVELRREGYEGRLGEVVRAYLEIVPMAVGEHRKVFVLSRPDDPATLRLAAPVVNDLRSTGGRITAFTQNQRYISSARLLVAKTTSELLAAGEAGQ